MLLALGALLATACGGSGSGPDGGAGDAVAGAFGAPCAHGSRCASGLCVATGGGAVCTHSCDTDHDCPEAANWGCVVPVDFAGRVCGCVADAPREICEDGRDNDCNGAVDDCRFCDGVPTPFDDPNNCGECGHACGPDQVCRDAACRCRGRRIQCDGACVDPASDRAHCGGCGRSCEPFEACVDGECDCPPGGPPDACPGDGCVDLSADPANCGSCGYACAPGLACVGGLCACAEGRAYCPGAGCVSTTDDAAHCGGCGVQCAAGQECVDGACQCPAAAPVLCDSGCVDLSTDADNCGACGASCRDGQVCTGGECGCPSPAYAWCDGACRNVGRDPDHCGGCGVRCGPNERCDLSRCVCDGLVCDGTCTQAYCSECGVSCGPGQFCDGERCHCRSYGLTECGPACADLQTDSANCGSCGNACAAPLACVGGECACPDGGELCPGLGCVDTSSDVANCGSCGNPCPDGTVCNEGSCVCPAGTERYCESISACVVLGWNEQHCGACDNACRPTEICSGTECDCPGVTERWCASENACVDTRDNGQHCGGCDQACPTGSTCRYYDCRCEVSGETPCPGGCTDTDTDSANCGSCGNACVSLASCEAGVCVCPQPTVSTTFELARGLQIYPDSTAPEIGGMVWAGGVYGIALRTYPAYESWAAFTTRNRDGTSTGVGLVEVRPRPADPPRVGRPGVAWDGEAFGVAWHERDDAAGINRIMFRRFAPDGTALAPASEVSGAIHSYYSGLVNVVLAYQETHGFVAGYSYESRPRDGWTQVLGADGTSPGAVWGLGTVGRVSSLAISPAGEIAALLYYSLYSEVRLQAIDQYGRPSGTYRTLTRDGSDGELIHDGSDWIATWHHTSGLVVARGDGLTRRRTVDLPSVRSVGLAPVGDLVAVTWADPDAGVGVARFRVPADETQAPVEVDRIGTAVSGTLFWPPLGIAGASRDELLFSWNTNWETDVQLVPKLLVAPLDLGGCP